jgi:hypothetical protein
VHRPCTGLDGYRARCLLAEVPGPMLVPVAGREPTLARLDCSVLGTPLLRHRMRPELERDIATIKATLPGAEPPLRGSP